MFIAGGLCAVLLYVIATKSHVAAWKKWAIAGAGITTIEFVIGGVVNIALGLNVWDYSGMRMNLMGQICLQFTLAWTLLSAPVIWLMRAADERLIKKGRLP
jgi:uncharacterized membrane protein